jgi:hypothetical protein
MRPPSIYELCRPRADVLGDRIRDRGFAVELYQVLKEMVPDHYRNSAILFAINHPAMSWWGPVKIASTKMPREKLRMRMHRKQLSCEQWTRAWAQEMTGDGGRSARGPHQKEESIDG